MADNNASLHIDLRATDNVTKAVKQAQSGLIRFVGAVSAAVASLKAITFPVSSAADFERALADVAKTTNFTEQELSSLSTSLIEMSRNMSVTALELANIAATAGQLGLGGQGVEAIEQFTESVARATITFGIGEQQVSQYAAQILQIFNIPTGKVENLFSEINELSNNSVASAQNLLDVMRRVGSIAGLTVQDVGALAASTADFGVTSEVAGTTLVKFFSNMQTKANDFAKTMNVSTQDWVNAVNTDALGAFKALTTQLATLDKQSQSEGIKELFGSGRIFSLAAKFVNDAGNEFEILNKNMANSESAFISGTSSIEEYEKVVTSFNDQMKILKNSFVALAIESGEKLLPQLKIIITKLQEFLDSDSAKDVFDSLVDSIGALVSGLANLVEVTTEFSALWLNLLPLIRVFLGFQIAKVVLGIGASLALNAVRLGQLAFSWKAATKAAIDYAKSSKLGEGLIAAKIIPTGPADPAILSKKKAAAYKIESAALANKIKYQTEAIAAERALNAQQAASLRADRQRRDAQGQFRNRGTAAERTANARAVKEDIAIRKASIGVRQKQIIAMKAQRAEHLQSIAASRAATAQTVRGTAARRASAAANILSIKSLRAMVAQMGLAATVGKGLALTFKGLGIALRALGGPITLIATAIYLFWDQISELFGFVTGTAKKSRDASLNRDIKAMKQHADKLVAVYSKTVNDAFRDTSISNQFTTQGIAAAQTVFDNEGPIAYSKHLDTVTLRFKQLTEAAQGAEIHIAKFHDKIDDVGAKVQDYERQLQELLAKKVAYNRRLAAINENDDPEDGGVTSSQEAEIAEIDAANAAIEERVTKLRSNIDELNAVSGALTEDLAKAQKDRALLLGSASANASVLAATLTTEGFEYLKATKSWADAMKEITATNEQLAALTKDRGKLAADDISEQAKELDNQIQDVESTLLILDRKRKQAEVTQQKIKNSTTTTSSQAANIARIETLGYEAVAGAIEAVDEAAIKSAKAIEKDNALRLFNTSAQLDANKRLLKSFNDMSAGLRSSIQTAKSVYDNMGSTINAMRKGNRAFGQELESIFRKQKQEFVLADEVTAYNKERAFTLSLEEGYYDRLIKQREAAGDTAGVERLQKEFALVKQQRDNVDTLAEAERKRLSLLDEQAEVIAEINKAAKQTEADKNFNEEEYRLQLQTEYKNNQKELTKAEADQLVAIKQATILEDNRYNTEKLQNYSTELQNISRELVELGGISVVDPLSNLRETFFSQDQLDNIKDQTQKALEVVAREVGKSIVSGNDLAVQAETELQATTLELSSSITSLGTQLTQLQKVLSNSKVDLGEIAKLWSTTLDSVTAGIDNADYGDMTKALSEQSLQVSRLTTDYFVNVDRLAAQLNLDITNFREEAAATVVKEADVQLPDAIARWEASPLNKIKVNTDLLLNENTVQADLDAMNLSAEVDLTLSDASLEELKLSIGGKAAGGHIRGAGTGTSDSILSWLSNGEYVIRASAVDHFGSGFFDALNAMRLPKFATGGAVGAATTAVSGGRDVVDLNLNFNGGTFPLSGDRDVVRGLTNALASMNKGTR